MADTERLTAYDALSAEHRQMLEVESGLDRETINARGYESVTDRSRLEFLDFANVQRRVPSLLMPSFAPDGSRAGHQLRPNRPRNRNNKPVKYENPKGSTVRIDCPPACHDRIGDPAVPLWITEGVKKGDSLAARGLCAIDLMGVWGFKGRNLFGGQVVSADLDYVALNGRSVFVVFDSDVMTKSSVALALERLSEHLRRKGAKVKFVYLPDADGASKTGVDDFLAAGHTVAELEALAVAELQLVSTDDDRVRIKGTAYFERDGRFWEEIQTKDGPRNQWLTTFTAQAEEEILVDDGTEQVLEIALTGRLDSGQALPRVQIPASQVNNLDWIVTKWGYAPIITAMVRGAKDRVREILQHKSATAGLKRRVVYSHTGWRDIGGQWRYLMPNESLDTDAVEVQLATPYARYSIPRHPDQLIEGVKASLRFLDVGERRVTIPLLTMAYLAPLQSILAPSFTAWVRATSGSFKSTVTALLMCHFGDFQFNTPPDTWAASDNAIERMLFDLKDCLAWVDDFNPRQSDTDMAKQYTKADTVLRAIGNRQGRGRMNAQLERRKSFPPRAVLISTGEIYPSGESVVARMVAIEMSKGSIDLRALTNAQNEAHLYRQAMSGYIGWLAGRYEKLRTSLPTTTSEYRARASSIGDGQHARMPNVVASMQATIATLCEFAVDIGAATDTEMDALYGEAWDVFNSLTGEQAVRMKDEGLAEVFLNALDTLYTQKRIVFHFKGDDKDVAYGKELVGWYDSEHIYLDPDASWNRVARFLRDQGSTIPGSKDALRHALFENRILIQKVPGRMTTPVRINGHQKRVIVLDPAKISFGAAFGPDMAMEEWNEEKRNTALSS